MRIGTPTTPGGLASLLMIGVQVPARHGIGVPQRGGCLVVPSAAQWSPVNRQTGGVVSAPQEARRGGFGAAR